MHIHKIEPNKHKNFLSQNRKDPITGDLIVSTDEVVFCASCKSVFLADTWIYLGKWHCEQSETLEKFPISSTLLLRDKVLFYNFLTKSKSDSTKIPFQITLDWNYKSKKLSPFKFDHKKLSLLMFILQVICFITTMITLFSGHFIIGILTAIGVFVTYSMTHSIPDLINKYYGKRLQTAHKFFKRECFFITHTSVGFSTKYGKEEYTFPYRNIDKIVFREATHFLKNDSISIFYSDEDRKREISTTLSSVFYNRLNFLDAFQYLASHLSKPIELKLHKQKHIDKAKEMIEKRKANFILIS